MAAPESHNVQVVRALTRAVSEKRFEEVRQYLHDECVVDVPYQAFFQGPMRRGGQGVAAGFAFIPQVFSEFVLTLTEIYDCPRQNSVVFEQVSSGVLAATGGAFANRYLMILGFRDGKVVLWREYFNPETMNALLAPLLALS